MREFPLPKTIKALTIIFYLVSVVILGVFFYLPFRAFKYPSREVYVGAILYPILLVVISVFLIINYKILLKAKAIKLKNAVIIFNYILLVIMVVGVIASFIVSVPNAFLNGYSYTEDYFNYSDIIEDNEYYLMLSKLPRFKDKEVASFKYYYDTNDYHQEDLFIELKYDDDLSYKERLDGIKNGLGDYTIVTNPFDSSYKDIILKTDNSFSVEDYGTFFLVSGSYFSVSYKDEIRTILINRLVAPADLFVDNHNPFIFEYFNYEYTKSYDYKPL